MAQRGERRQRTTGVFSRRGLALVSLGVVALAGAGGGAWQWWFGLPPEIDGPATMNRISAERFGDLAYDSPDNAVVHYRTLFVDVLGLPGAPQNWYHEDAGNSLLRQWQAARRDSRLSNLIMGDWDDPRQDKGKRLLAQLRPILDPLDRAADARGFRPRYSASSDIFNPDDSGGPIGPIDITLSHLGLFRSINELNTIFLRAAANDDDWTGVTRRVRTGMRHARHTACEPFFISTMVAISIEHTTLQELRFTINEHDIPADACDAMIDELERAPAHDMSYSLETERLAYPSAIRYTYLGESRDFFTPEYWRAVVENPPPRLALRDGRRFHAEMEAYIALPHAQRTSQPIPDAGTAAYFLPAFSRVIDQFETVAAQRAATIVLLRLERFHAMNGRWPATLTEAMTPEQATDPVTGAPFIYLVGSDGLSPPIDDENEEAYLPSDLALARTRGLTFERTSETVGPGWPFTLLAPAEAMFVRDPEFTTRRGVIWEPPVRDFSLR